MGTSHEQVDRIHSALRSEDIPPPPMFPLFKDHKETKPGEPCPPTRPVVSAREGPLARMSQLVSKILTPVADKLSEQLGTECSSTEEMARGIQDANLVLKAKLEESSERMEEPPFWVDQLADSVIILSQDVEGLYPELRKEEVIKVVGKLLEETGVTFENVDYRQLGKYLAIHLSPEEIDRNNLKSVVPKKVKNRKAGVAFLESDQDRQGEDKWDWRGKRKDPSILQKKKMIARSMEIAVTIIMENHLYQFDGKVFRQKDGGPIGLEITGVLARLVMLWWDGEYSVRLEKLNMPLEFYKRYVDDGNMVSRPVRPGVRLVNGKLSILEEEVESDEQIPADLRTARLLKAIANTISPMHQFYKKPMELDL